MILMLSVFKLRFKIELPIQFLVRLGYLFIKNKFPFINIVKERSGEIGFTWASFIMFTRL